MGAYELSTANDAVPVACAASLEPEMMPGAPITLGTMKAVNKSHTRLQNTPTTMSTQATLISTALWRFFANTRMQNGITRPQMISNQKKGAVGPVVKSAKVSAPAAPG